MQKKVLQVLFVLFLFLSIQSCDDEDSAPQFIQEFTTSIKENPSNTLSLGNPGLAGNQAGITFSLRDENPSNALSIDSQTGELRVKNGNFFDFETRQSITATAVATVSGTEQTAPITINITDVDQVGDILTTSLSSYNSLADNEWLEITANEYALLTKEVKSLTVGGLQDVDFASKATSFSPNFTQASTPGTYGSTVINALPSNSYLFAFKITANASSITGLKIKASTTSISSGYNDVGNAIDISNTSANSDHYFVMKPSVSYTNAPYTAVYTGSTGGIRGLSISGTRLRYWSRGDSNSLISISSNLPNYQVLSTTEKSW